MGELPSPPQQTNKNKHLMRSKWGLKLSVLCLGLARTAVFGMALATPSMSVDHLEEDPVAHAQEGKQKKREKEKIFAISCF